MDYAAHRLPPQILTTEALYSDFLPGSILLPSNTAARIRLVTWTRSPIIGSAIAVIDSELAQFQAFLWLIQRQDVDREELMLRSLKFKLSITPTMDPTIGTEVFVDVFGSPLVVLDLGFGARRHECEIFRRDPDRRVPLLQADGAVAA